MPFETQDFAVRTRDGRNCVLIEPVVYVTNAGERIEVPRGTTTDGASTPRFLWCKLPPFGPYWPATVLHDFLYRNSKRSREECDAILLEAMVSLGVDLLVREEIYAGVRVGGKWAFEEDRKQQTK